MHKLTISTPAHSCFVNITAAVAQAVTALQLREGVVTVFIPHTTCGVTINENADPDVVTDMLAALERMAPWEAGYRHDEGNAAAHVKASMMGFGREGCKKVDCGLCSRQPQHEHTDYGKAEG